MCWQLEYTLGKRMLRRKSILDLWKRHADVMLWARPPGDVLAVQKHGNRGHSEKTHAVKPQQVNVGKHAEEYTTKFHVKKKQKYHPTALPDHATKAESPGENFKYPPRSQSFWI